MLGTFFRDQRFTAAKVLKILTILLLFLRKKLSPTISRDTNEVISSVGALSMIFERKTFPIMSLRPEIFVLWIFCNLQFMYTS